MVSSGKGCGILYWMDGSGAIQLEHTEKAMVIVLFTNQSVAMFLHPLNPSQ